MSERHAPESFRGFAEVLSRAAGEGRGVAITGAGTKRGWGNPVGRAPLASLGTAATPPIVLSTEKLNRLYAHNAVDHTAVVAAGATLAQVQQELAAEGQRIALDPPLGPAGASAATVGGIFATADSGPLRHRYGSPRDQILGLTAALSDGTVIRTGANVIRSVAGYDVPKLFCGAYGTLGVILAISVRLYPVPERTATALGLADGPETLARAAAALSAAPLELEALDVAWRDGRGGLLAQVGGAETRRRMERVTTAMAEAGLGGVEVTDRDAGLWARQRAGQRSAQRAMVRVDARPSDLGRMLALSDRHHATLVGRAALGTSYLELDPASVSPLRSGLPDGAAATLLDLPASNWPQTASLARWDVQDGPELALMRAVKAQFDPAAVCNPGVYVGGI